MRGLMSTDRPFVTAHDALARLREGNQRYIHNVRSVDSMISHSRRDLTLQAPFAIVLGCSDSRAPAEIVFDQGLADLFVIRVAGNIVAPSQIGSVEFAAERFGTRLVVVMGHSNCGAITTTLDELRRPTANQSKNLKSIVDRVRPAIESLVATELNPEALVHHCVRANVRMAAHQLRHGSEMLERM